MSQFDERGVERLAEELHQQSRKHPHVPFTGGASSRPIHDWLDESRERYYRMARFVLTLLAEEREECAKAAEHYGHNVCNCGLDVANAIRARGRR